MGQPGPKLPFRATSKARGACHKGSACKFAHGVSSLRAKPDQNWWKIGGRLAGEGHILDDKSEHIVASGVIKHGWLGNAM